MTQSNFQSKSRKFRRTLCVETLENRRVMASLPFGAIASDTAEFMLGKVAVTPVFLESDGQIDTSTEDWSSAQITSVLDKINTGLDWWEETLASITTKAELQYTVDTTYALTPVATKYEPISRISNDYSFWVQEFLNGVGQSGTDIQQGIRAFNESQRQKLAADWSFTIFVVNSQNDPDGQFASGGSFSRAFAFAGGLFEVIPSTRPASTFTHETGHMFWARDEYAGGGSFFQRRGYYNTPNDNASDNPTPGFVQQPSIMAAGTLLDTAFANHVSPPSTLAMIGWQDSDSDGIFDVLDVPLKLSGQGYLDRTNNHYLFEGTASVQTLPNLNTSGNRNDITVNRIRSIDYRVDGGAWQVFSQPNTYTANLNLSIPVPSSATTIDIRARDTISTVESNIFHGRLNRADATLVPGVNGFTWLDINKNGNRDVGEFGLSGWTVNILNSSGQPLNLRKAIEPDSYPDGVLATGFSNDVSLSSVGADADGRVAVFGDATGTTSTGVKNFRGFSKASQSYLSSWTSNSRRLQVNFSAPTSKVDIDVIGVGNGSYGRLEVYNAAGQLLGRTTSSSLNNGQTEKLTIARGAADIAYAIVGGHLTGSVRLDNLNFGAETQVVTGANGRFAAPSLPAGNYIVQISQQGFNALTPTGGLQPVTIVANTAAPDIDFGFSTASSPWQNTRDPNDVNDDGIISALDVLLIVNDINANGIRDLGLSGYQAPPYIDVNGDRFVAALDVLLVVNYINSRGSGEGEIGAAENQWSSVITANNVGAEGSDAPADPAKTEWNQLGWTSPGVDPLISEDDELLSLLACQAIELS